MNNEGDPAGGAKQEPENEKPVDDGAYAVIGATETGSDSLGGAKPTEPAPPAEPPAPEPPAPEPEKQPAE